jgi:hypothetical protein
MHLIAFFNFDSANLNNNFRKTNNIYRFSIKFLSEDKEGRQFAVLSLFI